jgi:hypothetical protein
MPLNLFDQAIRQLSATMQTKVPRTIVYRRPVEGGADQTAVLTSWEGQTVFRTNTKEKSFLDWSGKDFLVVRSELVLDGEITEPRKGDFIVRVAEDATTETYELSAPAGEPLWRKSDPQGYIIRIHTKKVVYAG